VRSATARWNSFYDRPVLAMVLERPTWRRRSPAGPTAFSIVLNIASTVNLLVTSPPSFQYIAPALSAAGLAKAVYIGTQKAAAHLPSTAGKKIKTTE
jgi:hypothetical protein